MLEALLNYTARQVGRRSFRLRHHRVFAEMMAEGTCRCMVGIGASIGRLFAQSGNRKVQ